MSLTPISANPNPPDKLVVILDGCFAMKIKQVALVLMVMMVGLAPLSAQAETVILALGDSLTAGYGLPQADGFTAQLQARLQAAGHDVTIKNAGVSGDTSAGGLARLDWVMGGQVDAAIVQLGANDAMRGLDPEGTKANLDAILEKLKAKGIPILLAGMKAPPNYGGDYGKIFNDIYPALATKHDVALYPFFLEGVVAQRDLNQADGIHPTAQGVKIIVDKITPFVADLITSQN